MQLYRFLCFVIILAVSARAVENESQNIAQDFGSQSSNPGNSTNRDFREKWDGRNPVLDFVWTHSSRTGTNEPNSTEIKVQSSSGFNETFAVLSERISKSRQSRQLRENCSCSYDTGRKHLHVFVNGKTVHNRIQLKQGDTALIRCEDSTMDLVWPNGRSSSKSANITCDECNKLQNNDFPFCQGRKSSDVNIDWHIRCSSFLEEEKELIIDYEDIETRPGSRVTFSCRNSNLTLNGTEELVCLESGKWSSAPPQCTTISCFPPENPKNGKVIFSSLTFGSQIGFQCDDGYHLQDKTPVYCTSNGTWSKTDVKCVVISCDPPKDPNNGRVIYNSLSIGSELKHECDEGYQLQEKQHVVCTSNGTWNKTDITCDVVTCDRPADPKNGKVIYNSLNFGSELKYQCVEGYHLQDEKPVRCTSDGTWSKTEMACVEPQIRCPPIDDNGVFVIVYNNDRSVNSTASYYCKDAKHLISGGSNTRTCGPTGEWSGANPTCEDTSCFPPENPKNGTVIFSSLTLGSQIEFKCDDGYHLQDKTPVYCTSNRTWSKTDVTCVVISCDTPEDPKNGRVIYNSLSIGSELKHECHEGYRLQEKQHVVCTSNGTWSETNIICDVVTCDRPADPKNGKVIYNSLNFGSELKYQCDEGYHLQEEQTVRCTLDGTWSKTEMACVAVSCDRPQDPKNGRVIYDSLNFGSELKYECDDGYRLLDTPPVRCTSDGTWSTTNVTCNMVSCDPPKDPENGRVTYISLHFGSELRYLCDDGYRLQDTRPVRCTSDGIWSKTDAACVVVSCHRPKDPKNGRVLYNSLNFGSVLQYECDEGYRLQDNQPVLCTPDGTWSKTDIACNVVSCHRPKDPKNGRVLYNSLNFGSELQYECDEGYRLQDNQPVLCTPDGTWSKTDIACNVITCDLPENPENGRAIFKSLEVGSVLEFKCNTGYQLLITGPVNCTLDGTWSRRDVKCVESPCYLQPLTLPKGIRGYIQMPYDSVVRLGCEKKLNLVGNPFAKCGNNGIWEYGKFQCISGCPPLEVPVGSKLIITSNKKDIVFGDTLSFDCPVGLHLNNTMQQIICHGDKWSDGILPDCVETF